MTDKILLVGDDSIMRDRLLQVFAAPGFLVLTAPASANIQFQLCLNQPHLVIIDAEDLEADKILRRIRTLSKVPVIVIRAPQDADGVVRCLDRGADDCLVQPVSDRELQARARALLRRSRRAFHRSYAAASVS